MYISHPNKTTHKKGFTLVELLVVIAIIGTLIGLLLPAVQMAREAGRKTTCLNNLRQLSMAMQSYEGVKKTFPGFRNNVTPENVVAGQAPMPASWVVALFPYFEQKERYAYWAKNIYSATELDKGGQPIESLTCPSVGSGSQSNLSYAVNVGQNSLAWNGATPPASMSAFVSNRPGEGVCLDQYVNPLGPAVKSIPARVSIDYVQLNDGTANTLLLAENNNSPYKTTFTKFTTLWHKAGGTNPLDKNDIGTAAECLGFSWYGLSPIPNTTPATLTTLNRISSPHSGGMVMVSFCDGRQTPLRSDIDPAVYSRLLMPFDRGGYAKTMGDPPTIQDCKTLLPLNESDYN